MDNFITKSLPGNTGEPVKKKSGKGKGIDCGQAEMTTVIGNRISRLVPLSLLYILVLIFTGISFGEEPPAQQKPAVKQEAPVKQEVPAKLEPLVKSIEIKGIKRIEEGAVKSKLTQKVNQPLSKNKIEEDIKIIYQMGYFDDVKVETTFYEGGLKLIYYVTEKPTIVKIGFDGNKNLKEDKLKEKATIIRGSIADTALIQDNVQKLKAYYDAEGYYMSQIYPILRYYPNNEANLIFEIKEGPKIKIRKLEIRGNNRITTRKIKKSIETTKWWWLSFLTDSGYVKQDVLEEDVKRIQDLYLDNGYINVKVSKPQVIVNKELNGITVVFEVEEGDQYRIAKVGIEGYHAFPDDVIKKLITIKDGEIFSKRHLSRDLNAISDFYTEKGYATANVTPEVVPNEKDKTASVFLKVEEGHTYHVGRIEFAGNTKTKDKVIRREIPIDEGDLYNSKKLKRSYQNITNLDIFETVDLSPKPKPDTDTVDLDVKVKEKSTSFVSFGGGYSSVDHIIGMVQLTSKNLFGTGQYAKISTEIGGKSSLYELTYTEPWFLDKPISLSGSIYKMDRVFIEYSRRAAGVSIGANKRFAEYWNLGATYRFEAVNVFDVKDDAPEIVKAQDGKATTSSITPSITRDTRDNYVDPSSGSRNSLYATYAGIGGTNQFVKSGIDSLWFWPFIGPTTLSLRGRYAYASGLYGRNLPVYERFYVGGISTIRGLGFGEAGPSQTVNTFSVYPPTVFNANTFMGGTTEAIGNVEIIYPIFPEIKLKGVVFFDTGGSYSNGFTLSDTKYTTGTGIRWISPFGPIRLEYGYNLDRKPGESQGRIEFSFGSFF
ncbi:MAG: outer membrane protein assembly factor BamA [Nitrospirae bacterium]|nr:outer membrane protein assembly factor BamA [Nitrospirota bacterium]